MRAMFIALSLLALPFGAAACGDDGGGSSCKSVGTAMCAKACSCGGCAFGDSSGGFGFDSEAECTQFFVTLGCGSGGSYATPDACLDAVDAAQCQEVGSGLGMGIDVGTACDGAE